MISNLVQVTKTSRTGEGIALQQNCTIKKKHGELTETKTSRMK